MGILLCFFYHTLTWYSLSPRIPHLYLARILSLSFHLNLALFLSFHFIFSADIPPPTFICDFTAVSDTTFICHLFIVLNCHLLCGGAFLHPSLPGTFLLHLLPYYSTLMWHFPRASPRSISTLLNMVSFSLFLSHLYMTLILFITPRQYYSPQLLHGFSAEDLPTLPWVLHSPQLFRGGFFTIFFAFTWILSFHGSLWIIAF